MNRKPLSRRTMLRGILAGGSAVFVGLPLLEAMVDGAPKARAGGDKPVRLITWFWGNGVNKARWVPGGLTTPVTGANYPLPDHLQAFAGVRDYLTVPTGFRNSCGAQITHHEGMTLFNGYTFNQTCFPGQQCGGFFSNSGGPTIDQVAAQHLAGLTPIPSVQLGVSKRISDADFGTTMHALSHKGTQEPLPPLRNPVSAYNQIFGNFTPAEDPSKPVRTGVLSAVNEQAKRLQARVGTRDKERLEAHLDGLSELETKINALPPVCELPSAPTEQNVDSGGVEPLVAVSNVMTELMVYAFTCDVTRVISMLFHEGASETTFPGAGNYGHHSASHNFNVSGSGNESGGGLSAFNAGMVFTMGQLAHLFTRLHETPDGLTGDNLLDNVAILAGSDCMDGWSHDQDSVRHLACLVGGKAGGRLVHPGIHLREVQRSVTDITLSVLKAVVPEVTSIGNVGSDPAASQTPIDALLVG